MSFPEPVGQREEVPDVKAMLARMVELGGSDLCLKVGNRPLVRIDGKLRWLDDDSHELEPHETMEMLHTVLPDVRLKEFENEHEVDFAYSVAHVARFRINAFQQRGSVSLVFRVVPFAVKSLTDLGLPEVIRTLSNEERGIVLVTGTTGSGKSTTLAAMIDHINNTAFKHIVTIEDPIEYLYKDVNCAIDQREVGSDTASFATALRRVLRQDPDVILIGEMRDETTVRTALAAAETGHLVLSTVHALDASETINRILDFFPPAQNQQARAMLAGTIKGIVSQRLVPRSDGIGRVAIVEVMTMTGRIHDLILDPERTGQIPDVVAQGAYYGMQTFDQALFDAVKAGTVTMDDAMQHASHPHDFRLLMATDGRRGTTMDDVVDLDDRREPEKEPEREPERPAASAYEFAYHPPGEIAI
jgi:twitching motility protein PilT